MVFDGARLMGHRPALHITDSVTAEIADGTYFVELISRDILHRSAAVQGQPNEVWFAEFLNAQGDVVGSSEVSADLPDNATLGSSRLGTPITLNGVRSVRGVHGAVGASPNSVQPVAVLLRSDNCTGFAAVVPLSDERKVLGFGNPMVNSTEPIAIESRTGPHRIYLESGDDEHSQADAPDQPRESWLLQGLGSAGEVLFETDATADLPPQDIGSITDVGVEDMTGVVALRGVHAAIEGEPNSVFALSAILVPEGDPTDPVDPVDVVLFEDDRLRIIYRRIATDETTYQARITIDNLSDAPISNWHLLFETDDQVGDVARGVLRSQKGREVLLGPGSSSGTIPAAGQATLEFAAASGDPAAAPPPAWALLLTDGMLPDADRDGDGIPDYIELRARMNPDSSDSDNDGLSDLVEFTVRLDPTSPDTDGDGVTDDQEDLDLDLLDNIDEIALGTELRNADTDQDLLDDGDERRRGTDPLNPDSDGDNVNDGTEVQIGSDPLVPETTFDATRSAEGAMASPSVSVPGLAADQVESFAIIPLPEDHVRLTPEIPGYIDQGYEFMIDGEFDQAEVQFTFDTSLQGPDFDPAIYTFDEQTQLLVEVSGQTIEGNVVTATIEDFSEYILLNREEFDLVWEFEFLEVPETQPFSRYDVVLAIDSSGSMTTNDPGNQRIVVGKEFVSQLGSGLSRAAVVDFDSTATVLSGLTSDQGALNAALDQIDSNGGTSISSGVEAALDLLEPSSILGPAFKSVVLLTDGAGGYSESLTSRAAADDVVIYTVGLGPDVDVDLLTGIASGTGGEYFSAAEAGELQEIFAAITDITDLFLDSDNDGLNDYYEKEMRAGRLRVGTGRPLVSMDPFDPDSDDDGLLDGQELSIRRTQVGGSDLRRVYADLRSDPQIVDSDGDGVDDPDDPLPLVFNPADLLIHQSANREGRRKEPDLQNFQVPPSQLVADDLTFNDYTFGDLNDLGFIFNVAPITPEFLIWSEFDSMLSVGKLGADADHRATVDGLRGLFRDGNGGDTAGVRVSDNYDPAQFNFYSSAAMNRAVGNSPQMRSYIDTAVDIIVDSIESNDGAIDHLVVQDDLNQNFLYRAFENEARLYPIFDFSVRDDNERALSIAIHQFHGHQIRLEDYEISGGQFSGTLVFRSYDHFGLDPDDGVTRYGFVDWFTLQHYDRFNGKYAPPLAIVEIEEPIRGSL